MLPKVPTSAVQPTGYSPGLAGGRPGRHIPGLALTLALALGALALARESWLQDHGISALTLSILAGIVLGNSAYAWIAGPSAAGVAFAKHTLLRDGIILYGLRLTFQDIGQVGLAGVLIDAIMLGSTFTLSWWLGTRLFGLDPTSPRLQ